MKINKDVFAKTKNKLLRINMIVVMCFLGMLLAFTMIYFRYITYTNIDKEIGQEFKHIVTSKFGYDKYIKTKRKVGYILDEDK